MSAPKLYTGLMVLRDVLNKMADSPESFSEWLEYQDTVGYSNCIPLLSLYGTNVINVFKQPILTDALISVMVPGEVTVKQKKRIGPKGVHISIPLTLKEDGVYRSWVLGSEGVEEIRQLVKQIDYVLVPKLEEAKTRLKEIASEPAAWHYEYPLGGIELKPFHWVRGCAYKDGLITTRLSQDGFDELFTYRLKGIGAATYMLSMEVTPGSFATGPIIDTLFGDKDVAVGRSGWFCHVDEAGPNDQCINPMISRVGVNIFTLMNMAIGNLLKGRSWTNQ